MSGLSHDARPLSVHLIAPDLRSRGGYEAQLATLAAGLRKAGHEVTVFFREPVSPDHPYLVRMLQAQVIVDAPGAWTGRLLMPRHSAAVRTRRRLVGAVYPVLALIALADSLARRRPLLRAWQGAHGRWHGLVSRLLFTDRLERRLGRTLDRSARPDIIDVQHSMIPFGIAYAASRSIPVVYTEYGAPSLSLDSVWAGLRPVLNLADRVIGRAEASISGLRLVCGLAEDMPWTIVPNAVTAAPPVDDVRALDLPPDGRDVVITTIGRLSPEKGTADMLSAFRTLVAQGLPVRLVLAGDGPLRPSLEAQAQEWGIADRVTFTGLFDDLAPIMLTTHIVAHPTLNDGRSVSVLEAMAWGRPVVATAIGGVAELLTHGKTGLLVPAGEPDALAAALRSLVTDAALRRSLGSAARAAFVAGGYTGEQMTAQTVEAYRQVMSGRSTRRHSGAKP